MTRTTVLCLTGAIILSVSVPAQAKINADTNQDGVISLAEFTAISETRFAATDTNNDGYISESEREVTRDSKRAEKTAVYFDHIDKNSDGFISRTEFEDGLNERRTQQKERRLDRRERLQQGDVSRQDRQEMREQLAELRSGADSDQKQQRDHWARIDTNGDGLISAQEHLAGAHKIFEYLDANGDGVISKGEGMKKPKRKRRGFFRR